MIILETPFTFPDGDGYLLYLSETRTGGIRISDGGNTLMRLSYENEVDNFFQGARGVLLEQIVAEQGISYNDESGLFYTETTESKLSEAAFKLGQALTRISDLTFLNRSRVASTFYDDLQQSIMSIVSPDKVIKDYEVPGISGAANYPVDYCIEGRSGLPLFLYGILGRDKARLTTIFLQYFLQAKVEFDSLLVFQDQAQIPRGDLARLSNVGGEMIANLNAEEDLRRKIERKAA